MTTPYRSSSNDWPDISYAAWGETAAALHLWTQVVGKVRLVRTPWTNHSWHVPFYLSGRGLTTSLMPGDPAPFEMRFDLLDHELVLQCTDGRRRTVALRPQSVADFHASVMENLEAIGVRTSIHTTPSEIADATPFERDTDERPYDADAATRFWRALVQMDRVFKEFRAGFIGKSSPVHFFWGSFDMAVTRFSGREAPPHPAGIPNLPDWVAREAYSHEVSSAGFWPGGEGGDAMFYSYAYPTPDGFSDAQVEPGAATWHQDLGEFVLPYDAVRTSSSPDETLLAFLQSTYDAAADLAKWDRDALERDFTTARV